MIKPDGPRYDDADDLVGDVPTVAWRRIDDVPHDELLQGLPHTTRVDRSTFSVRFFDLGAPIDIVAPPDPVDVAAVG